MKPIDLENLILVTLRSAGGKAGSDGMTINRLHKAITPAQGGEPSWRQVANVTQSLYRQGLVEIVADEQIDKETVTPIYALTVAGAFAAQQAVSLDPQLLHRPHTQETTDADH